MNHPAREAFERYITGAYDEIDRPAFEAHLIGCASCSKALTEEARLEVSIYGLSERPEVCVACERTVSGKRCDFCGAAYRLRGYRIQAVLSKSATGRVYLAETPTGQRVALKELLFSQVPGFEAVEAFEREGRVLRQLQHPRIPAYVDSFIDGEGVNMRFYLAQGFVAGASLADLLHRHRFTEAEVWGIARQVLEVLVYLQRLSPQVFHRDLKPSNLLQQPDGTIVLVDFGSARERGATVGGTVAGTFGYAPGEQMVGVVNATSDLYALGATLVQLLTREPPWEVLEEGLAASKANMSLPLRRWLSKMTAKKVRDRFASAEEALAVLEGAGRRPGSNGNAITAVALCGAALCVMVAGAVFHRARTAAPPQIQAIPLPSSDAPILAEPPAPPRPVVEPPRRHKARTPTNPGCAELDGQFGGFITIDAGDGVQLYDGEVLLGTSPITRLEVASGCHEFELRAPDGRKKQIRIQVEPSALRRYRIEL